MSEKHSWSFVGLECASLAILFFCTLYIGKDPFSYKRPRPPNPQNRNPLLGHDLLRIPQNPEPPSFPFPVVPRVTRTRDLAHPRFPHPPLRTGSRSYAAPEQTRAAAEPKRVSWPAPCPCPLPAARPLPFPFLLLASSGPGLAASSLSSVAQFSSIRAAVGSSW